MTLTRGAALTGLSPRVRGNLFQKVDALECLGSIPACAGEPARWLRSSAASRVYPRVCGGTDGIKPHEAIVKGLSPRVRGTVHWCQVAYTL